MSTAISEAAFEYAAVLAWTVHLDRLKSDFDATAQNSRSSMEQTCEAEELSIGIQVIRNYAMRTLAEHYREQESSDMQPSYQNLFAWFGSRTPEVSSSDKLEGILSSLHDDVGKKDALSVDSLVVTKLYVLLKNAIMAVARIPSTMKSDVSSALSQLLADYLSSQQPNLTKANAFKSLGTDTIAYLKGNTPAVCTWNEVFPAFKSFIKCHIEVTAADSSARKTQDLHVSRLREKGNNLSNNTCYPQAIQVYTDAIYACDSATRTHLPQLLTNRAIAYIGLNCFPEAVSDLERALQYDRTFVPAWAQMGYCQLYLGDTLLSMKSYNAALSSLAGEVYPYAFPSDELLKKEYTEGRARTHVPQFVQKLTSSFLLAANRASQQNAPIVIRAPLEDQFKSNLNALKQYASSEDAVCYIYQPEPNAEALRSAAARAESARPSILTPDVAQDIMASGNVEASAVTVSGPPPARNDVPIPIVPLNTTVRTAGESGPADNIPPTNTGGITSNFRGFLNTLGTVVGEAIQPPQASQRRAPTQSQTESGGTQNASQVSPGQENAENAENAERGTANSEHHNSHIARALASVRSAISTAQQNGNNSNGGAPPNNGMMEALRHHQAAMENMLNMAGGNTVTFHSGPVRPGAGNTAPGAPTVRIVHPRGNTQSRGNTSEPATAARSTDAARSANSQTLQTSSRSNSASPGPEDTDMPDALDLD
ncbi:hypothetical protein OXX59_005550 [Metschnikowia pulcherrima]